MEHFSLGPPEAIFKVIAESGSMYLTQRSQRAGIEPAFARSGAGDD